MRLDGPDDFSLSDRAEMIDLHSYVACRMRALEHGLLYVSEKVQR